MFFSRTTIWMDYDGLIIDRNVYVLIRIRLHNPSINCRGAKINKTKTPQRDYVPFRTIKENFEI